LALSIEFTPEHYGFEYHEQEYCNTTGMHQTKQDVGAAGAEGEMLMTKVSTSGTMSCVQVEHQLHVERGATATRSQRWSQTTSQAPD
jgi:hypothetical protein